MNYSRVYTTDGGYFVVKGDKAAIREVTTAAETEGNEWVDLVRVSYMQDGDDLPDGWQAYDEAATSIRSTAITAIGAPYVGDLHEIAKARDHGDGQHLSPATT